MAFLSPPLIFLPFYIIYIYIDERCSSHHHCLLHPPTLWLCSPPSFPKLLSQVSVFVLTVHSVLWVCCVDSCVRPGLAGSLGLFRATSSFGGRFLSFFLLFFLLLFCYCSFVWLLCCRVIVHVSPWCLLDVLPWLFVCVVVLLFSSNAPPVFVFFLFNIFFYLHKKKRVSGIE